MSITVSSVPSLPLALVVSAMPLLTTWRNSKGRIMPVHWRSAPGVGKTMLPLSAARSIARANPGKPVGLSAHNIGLKNPADVGGYMLFDKIDGQQTSTNTRPDLFAVNYAIIFDPEGGSDSGGFRRVEHDDKGQPLYWGSVVNGVRLELGIMLLDEFDQADIEVRKAAAPLLDEGRITQHYLPRDVAVWAASNRAKDASGTGRGLAFLTNRWCALEVEPDIEALEGYLTGKSLEDTVTPLSPTLPPEIDAQGRISRKVNDVDFNAHPAVLAYMRQMQDTLFAGVPADPNTPFLTPRSLEAVSNLFDVALRLSVADESGAMDPTLSFADSFIPRRNAAPIDGVTGDPVSRWRVFQALAGGTVGVENTSQFLATLELFDEVPTVADIVKDPMKARVSEKMDAQFITGYMVGNAMRPDNGSALMKYAKRLQDALYHNAVFKAISRDGALLAVPEIAQYMRANPEALIRMNVVSFASQKR